MIEEAREPIRQCLVRAERRLLERAVRREGAREGVEVAGEGVLAVDDRLAPAERAPEVVDVARVRTRLDPECERAGVRSDEHRDGACALRRLARRAELVARDVRGDDERAPRPRAPRSHPVGGRHQRRRAGEVGVLRLVDAAARPDAEQLVHEDADGLRVIPPRLGGDHEHPDRLGIDVGRAEEPRARRRGEGDDVLARRDDRHLLHPEARGELLGGDVSRRGELGESEGVLGNVGVETLDADGHGRRWSKAGATLASDPRTGGTQRRRTTAQMCMHGARRAVGVYGRE